MDIKLFLNKNINDNANYYFEKAKKLKAKIPGLEKAMKQTKKEIENFEDKKELYFKNKKKEEILKLHKKKEWYDKFRWTKTSNDFLLVIGKDATTNEVLIKKHLEDNDLVFHTEAAGSPFGVLKDAKNKAEKQDLEEAAQFICSFSKQWKKGFGTADAFWVEPNQVTKKAQTGEFISKGSFMIYGNKNILKNIPLQICFGVIEKKIEQNEDVIKYYEQFSGSEKACKKNCKSYIKIEPGTDSYKKATKEIKSKLKLNKIEDLPTYIPNGIKVLKR